MSPEWISIKLAALTHLISPKSIFQVCSVCQRLLYYLLAFLLLTVGQTWQFSFAVNYTVSLCKSHVLVAVSIPFVDVWESERLCISIKTFTVKILITCTLSIISSYDFQMDKVLCPELNGWWAPEGVLKAAGKSRVSTGLGGPTLPSVLSEPLARTWLTYKAWSLSETRRLYGTPETLLPGSLTF